MVLISSWDSYYFQYEGVRMNEFHHPPLIQFINPMPPICTWYINTNFRSSNLSKENKTAVARAETVAAVIFQTPWGNLSQRLTRVLVVDLDLRTLVNDMSRSSSFWGLGDVHALLLPILKPLSILNCCISRWTEIGREISADPVEEFCRSKMLNDAQICVYKCPSRHLPLSSQPQKASKDYQMIGHAPNDPVSFRRCQNIHSCNLILFLFSVSSHKLPHAFCVSLGSGDDVVNIKVAVVVSSKVNSSFHS
jgi:hypothetical protein